jgi:GIY-YIG catalytic domain
MRSGIYKIQCVVTDQVYVGTALDWQKRINQHLNRLQNNQHKNVELQQAWNKYGAASFDFGLLESCSVESLLEREKYWVSEFDSDINGFNRPWCLGSNGFLSHGKVYTRTYKSWNSMKQRCLNPNSSDYPSYGGKGIKIHLAWLNFENFYADMGERPEGTSLDRFPNNKGDYEPGNCRWATSGQQQRNIRTNIYLTIQGETKLLVDWAEQYNVPKSLLQTRHRRGVTGLGLLAKSYYAFEGVKDADGEVIKTQRKLPPAKVYSAHGKTLTIAQWAIELDISQSALKQRLFKFKLPLEEALVAGQRQKGKRGPREGHKMITAFGKTQSLTNWSRELGMPYSTLKNRLYRAKMPVEDALKC